jgi:hypothetical protein
MLCGLPEARLPATPVPIHVALPGEDGLESLLRAWAAAAEPFPHHAFARLEQSAGYDVVARPLLEMLAARMHLAHEAIRAAADGAAPDGRRPRLELTQIAHADALPVDAAAVLATLPPAFRASSEEAAAHAAIKLDAIGYRHRAAVAGEAAPAVVLSPAQVGTLAHMEHNRWMAERLVTGWRAGARDDRRRRRPSLRAWEHLEDQGERMKDVGQIVALVRALNAAGRVLERIGGAPAPAAAVPVGAQLPSVAPSASVAPAASVPPGGTTR